MEKYIVKILSTEWLNYNVKRVRVEKPIDYHFTPGQATEITINQDKFLDELRPFTFTSLPEDSFLEFTIKIYSDHRGITNEIGKLAAGDELILHDVWGAIKYIDEGYFFAAGAGITPFIAILRNLHKQNKIGNNVLFFSNSTENDVFLYNEFKTILGENFKPIITSLSKRIDSGFINENVSNINKNFYVCGPKSFVKDINSYLFNAGAQSEALIFEK